MEFLVIIQIIIDFVFIAIICFLSHEVVDLQETIDSIYHRLNEWGTLILKEDTDVKNDLSNGGRESENKGA